MQMQMARLAHILGHETLEIAVLEDGTLDGYALATASTTASRTGAAERKLNRVRWLPKWKVKAGDTVVIHNRCGFDHGVRDKGKPTVWHVYLNRRSRSWDATRRPVLIKVEVVQGCRWVPWRLLAQQSARQTA